MTVYYVTFFSVLLFASLAQRSDYVHYDNELSYCRVFHTRNTRICFIIASFILILVAGLRYNVGTDFGAYYKQYHDYADAFAVNLIDLNEPGYGLICKISELIRDDYGTSTFLVALVTLGLSFGVIYRNTDRICEAVLLFVFLECWHVSFNAVRQCLAAAVLFCGFSFLRDKKYFKYAIVVLLAFLCHKSAIVLFLICLVVHRDTKPINIVVLIVGTIALLYSYDLLFAFQDQILDDGIVHYSYVTNSVNIIRVLANCTPAVFFLIFSKAKTKERDFYLNLLLIHAAIQIASSNSTYFARMAIYTAPFVAIAIPELLKTVEPSLRKKITPIIIILFAIFCIHDINISPSLNNFMWLWQR